MNWLANYLNVDWLLDGLLDWLTDWLSRGGGGVLPRILDWGMPQRFVNPNPI